MRVFAGLLMLGFGFLCLPASQAQVPSQGLPAPYGLEPNAPGNYLAPLAALRPARERYAASPQWRDSYFEELAAHESFVGNDAEAVADFDLAGPPPEELADAEARAAVGALRGYRPTDARQTILNLAKTHQVIFINEAHHVPAGRAFTLSLLSGLYARGFRYFAAETLGDGDAPLQARGYPTQKTGYYTSEPVFGDLVRTALRLGFNVIPYEYHLKPSQGFGTSANPVADEELREQGEAQNLYDHILKHDPKAKILVHAGYGHISKQAATVSWAAGDLGAKTAGSGPLLPMAVCFERISGIVPFSIDQSNLYAHSAPIYESLLYRHVTDQRLVKDTPVVFRNAQGRYYVPPKAHGAYDLVICHPRPRYASGRPTWMRMGGLRRPVAVSSALLVPRTGLTLVQAFYTGEDTSQAVPVDQVEIKPDAVPPALMLPAGRFLVRAVDGAGKTLSQQTITVKETH